jgi:hypothetical protein
MKSELRRCIAKALGGGMTGAALAETVLDALEVEHVGWWVEDKHRHENTDGTIFGEFRFTEEDEDCPLSGWPVYCMKGMRT